MSATPSASAQAFSFVERLAKDLEDERLELPAFPDAVIRIQRALQSEHTKPDDIANILSSEPALAARLLKMANSVEFKRGDTEITDLPKAIGRMGFNMIRSVAVSFAMRQIRRKDDLAAIQPQLESIWQDSINTAAYCHVLARKARSVNTDEALLAGLLHVLGRLYIVMRARELNVADDTEVNAIVTDWHATIAQAIAENWGLPESLRDALAGQDNFDATTEGALSQTDVLQAARLFAQAETIDAELMQFPVMARFGFDAAGLDQFTSNHAEQLKRVRDSLTG